MSDGKLPIITHKTSHVSAELDGYIKTKVGPPAHFIAPSSGFGAALLVHAEMEGIAGYSATLITDSHYVSTESMSGYEPVLAQIGLNLANIGQKPRFKELLKEANQRANAIFS